MYFETVSNICLVQGRITHHLLRTLHMWEDCHQEGRGASAFQILPGDDGPPVVDDANAEGLGQGPMG